MTNSQLVAEVITRGIGHRGSGPAGAYVKIDLPLMDGVTECGEPGTDRCTACDCPVPNPISLPAICDDCLDTAGECVRIGDRVICLTDRNLDGTVTEENANDSDGFLVRVAQGNLTDAVLPIADLVKVTKAA